MSGSLVTLLPVALLALASLVMFPGFLLILARPADDAAPTPE